MSRQLVHEHAARLVRPGARVHCVDDGETVVVVLEQFTPPNAEAYTPSILEALAFIVAVTYPDAEPDPTGFYAKPVSLALATKQPLASASAATLLGEPWLKLSWKRKTFQWDPNIDTLETHLATIENRFRRGT